MTDYRMTDAVVVLKDIEGTGIRAGLIGKVVAIQNGTRGIGRSTDLAPYAIQVRFKGGAEIWMTKDEIAPTKTTDDDGASDPGPTE